MVIAHGSEDAVLGRLVHADLISAMMDESSGTSDVGDLEGEDELGWVDPLGANQSPKKGSQLMRKSEEKAAVAFGRFVFSSVQFATLWM